MKGTVHYEKKDDVALLTVDNPPVNPLSSGVRQGLHDGVSQALHVLSFIIHLFLCRLLGTFPGKKLL